MQKEAFLSINAIYLLVAIPFVLAVFLIFRFFLKVVGRVERSETRHSADHIRGIMQYRRSTAKGSTFFFTVVTHERRKILCHESNVSLLREAFRSIMERHPFVIDAFVLLPDHLHCIWTLPENDSNFSMRWRQIKSHFSRQCRDEFKGRQTTAHLHKGEQAIWQRRYWEHQIRDDGDFIKHVEYIHYNPVKHGLTKSPKLWPHSTFHRYVNQGIYHADWGADDEIVFGHHVGME